MLLSSKPKRVNFRIVLDNTEITSLESLRENFDLERLLINDRLQLISWLKRVDQIKSDEIETIFRESKDMITDQSITKILSVIYAQDFADMVEFVNYLYKNGNEKSKRNFAHFMLKHEELLYEWFPIDRIPQENSGIDELFTIIRKEGTSQDAKWYFSQLCYRAGDFQQSKEINPYSWVLRLDERLAIEAICSGTWYDNLFDVFYSNQLSIIGVEFLFLCTLGYVILNQTDSYIMTISNMIDKIHEFSFLRDRIGEDLVKILNKKKKKDFEQLIVQLGYLCPNPHDPLYNEKLFLSSFVVKNNREAIIQEICNKKDYFPAHFILGEESYQSETLIQPNELMYQRWFRHILDYHCSPQGIDGDVVKNLVREEVIIAHLFKTHPRFMKDYFYNPQNLAAANERNERLQKRIQRLQDKLTEHVLSAPPKLSKLEKEYVNFYQQIYSKLTNLTELFGYTDYLRSFLFFTVEGSEIIKDFSKLDGVLKQEKFFIVQLLYIIKDGRKSNITNLENKLRADYIPLKALFQELKDDLSNNDKLILNYDYLEKNNLFLSSDWSLLTDFTALKRLNIINVFLKRWVANFIYYINPNLINK